MEVRSCLFPPAVTARPGPDDRIIAEGLETVLTCSSLLVDAVDTGFIRCEHDICGRGRYDVLEVLKIASDDPELTAVVPVPAIEVLERFEQKTGPSVIP